MINLDQEYSGVITINDSNIPNLSISTFRDFILNNETSIVIPFQVATSAAATIGLPSQRYTVLVHIYTSTLVNIIAIPFESTDTHWYKMSYMSNVWSEWITCG